MGIIQRLHTLACLLTLTLLAFGTQASVRPLADLPFRYVRGAVLLDHVRINGRGDYTFLVDTGATTCTVTAPVAKKLGLRATGWSHVRAIGASRKLPIVKVRSMTVGGLTVNAPPTLIADDNGLSQHVNGPVHGVLGTPFLWKWPVEFDYPAKRLRVYPRSFDIRTAPVEAPWSGAAQLVMRGPMAYVQVALNGAKPSEMMLDTGATGIVVSEARVTEARARDTKWKSTLVGALGPRHTSQFWLLDTVRVAGLNVVNAQAFTLENVKDWTSDQLGNDALDEFRVTIDTARRVMRLERNEMLARFPADGPFSATKGLGIEARRDPNGIRVAAVFPNSDAARKGIRPGDEILSVDGRVARDETDATLRDLLLHPSEKQVQLEVRAQDGPTRVVEVSVNRYTLKRPESSGESIAVSLSVVQPTLSR